jgi:predicted Zn-dependent peptidase
LSHVLGGGLTSRLFREVREKRGLSYAVGSDLSLYTDAGILLLYATCSPRRAEETASVIAAELEAILTDRPVSEAELERTKAAIRGSFAIADESMRSRMHRIGRSALLQGEPASANEVVQRYEAVSMADMDEVRQRLQASPLVSVRVGPKP